MRRTTSFSESSPSLLARTLPPSRPTLSDEHRSDGMRLFLERKRRQYSSDLTSVNVTDLYDAAHFLNVCGLCTQRIGPGTDTFIYRGEVAFCSKECRDKRIREERRKERKERKERKKRSLVAMKNANLLPPIKAFELSA